MTAMNMLGRTPAEADRDTAGPAVAPFDRRVIAVGARGLRGPAGAVDAVRVSPRRAVLHGVRPASAGQLRRPAGADAAAGVGFAEAVRRVAAGLADVAGPGGLGDGRGGGADGTGVRRRPPGATAGRDRHRDHAGRAGRRSPVRPDGLRPAGLGGPGAGGGQDRADR